MLQTATAARLHFPSTLHCKQRMSHLTLFSHCLTMQTHWNFIQFVNQKGIPIDSGDLRYASQFAAPYDCTKLGWVLF